MAIDSNPQRLAGKVAVITGGSSGIGLAIAQLFAAEGCNIVITGRNSQKLSDAAAKLSSSTKSEIIAQACDVRDAGFVQALFSMVKARFSRIDILINNAGISQPATPLLDMSPEMWRAQIDTNLTGLFLCTRAALPLMQPGGSIVNNLSMA